MTTGPRDLITEIGRACKGDADAMDYLRALSPEDWESDPHALGQFLQEGHFSDPEWLERFVAIFDLVIEHHGKKVLTDYLQSSVGGFRSTAITVLEELGSPRADWAVPLIDATAEDTEMPLWVREAAAKAAAAISGRPEAAQIEPAKVVDASVDALRDALENLSWGDDDAVAAVTKAAARVGDPAISLFEELIPRWAPKVAGWRMQDMKDQCPPFAKALANLIARADDEELMVFAEAALLTADDEERLNVILENAPAELVGEIAKTIANITREAGVARLAEKDTTMWQYGANAVSRLAPRHLIRQAVGIVDGLAVLRTRKRSEKYSDMVVSALAASDADAIAQTLASYFESGLPQDRYWRATPTLSNEKLLTFIRERTEPWAQKTLDRLT